MRENSLLTHDWRRAAVYLLTVCSLFILAGLLGTFAIAGGHMAGPPIDVQIGPYHVLSRTTTSPTCHPLTMGCLAPQPARATASYYTVWVLSTTETPIPGGLQEQLTSARLLTLPIR